MILYKLLHLHVLVSEGQYFQDHGLDVRQQKTRHVLQDAADEDVPGNRRGLCWRLLAKIEQQPRRTSYHVQLEVELVLVTDVNLLYENPL